MSRWISAWGHGAVGGPRFVGSKSRFSLDAEKTMGTMVFVGKMNLGSWGSRSRFSLDAEKMMGTMDFDGKMNSTWVRENDGIGASDRSGRGRFA